MRGPRKHRGRDWLAAKAANARHVADLKEEIRKTLDELGWNAPGDEVIADTARRLAGEEATDDALEAKRAQLWPVFNAHFCTHGG